MPATVLLAHNTYQWPGGEDVAFEADGLLLESRGHRVVRYLRDNDEIEGLGALGRARVAGRTIWAGDSAREVRRLLSESGAEIAHFHNTFPLISPAAFTACRREGVPVVLTVQNFRLGCPNAYLFRDGHVCEDCLHKKIKWPGVLHACYRDSRAQSAVVAGMLAVHSALRTWVEKVDVFVTVSKFASAKLVESGVPADKIVRRPNFLAEDPGDRTTGAGDDFALFAGRLSPEKGIATLLEACEMAPDVEVRIAGDGPLRELVDQAVARLANVQVLGAGSRPEVLELMRTARTLIVPSIWYEHFPFVLLEAFASGLPAIATDLGSTAEIVGDNDAGRLFPAGDASALADRLRWAITHPDEMTHYGRRARATYEAELTPDPAYTRLIAAYDLAWASQ